MDLIRDDMAPAASNRGLLSLAHSNRRGREGRFYSCREGRIVAQSRYVPLYFKRGAAWRGDGSNPASSASSATTHPPWRERGLLPPPVLLVPHQPCPSARAARYIERPPCTSATACWLMASRPLVYTSPGPSSHPRCLPVAVASGLAEAQVWLSATHPPPCQAPLRIPGSPLEPGTLPAGWVTPAASALYAANAAPPVLGAYWREPHCRWSQM